MRSLPVSILVATESHNRDAFTGKRTFGSAGPDQRHRRSSHHPFAGHAIDQYHTVGAHRLVPRISSSIPITKPVPVAGTAIACSGIDGTPGVAHSIALTEHVIGRCRSVAVDSFQHGFHPDLTDQVGEEEHQPDDAAIAKK